MTKRKAKRSGGTFKMPKPRRTWSGDRETRSTGELKSKRKENVRRG
jgi:hypothetical protein